MNIIKMSNPRPGQVVQCIKCYGMIEANKAFLDLDGTPYKSYYHKGCIPNTIKLKLPYDDERMQSLENYNPGFEIGDSLEWDNVPAEKQPRPKCGVVMGFWHNGCIVETKENHPMAYYTFDLLCNVTKIQREN